VSLDEMTGIQALERTMPAMPMKPGSIVKREFEYIRHGTQSLIASFNVATGEIEVATVGATHTEQDLEAHVVRLMAKHPTAPKYHVVMDCLNTHQPEALVRLVARLEPEGLDLGIKGKSALVCAASKGLGKGCAQALAAEGVNVTLVARGPEALDATAESIRQAGRAAITPRLESHAVDRTKSGQTHQSARRIKTRFAKCQKPQRCRGCNPSASDKSGFSLRHTR